MPRLRKPLSAAEELTAKEIRKNYGDNLTLQKVMEYLGVSRHTAERWVKDIDSININGRKRYQAADIARKIEANRIPGGC